MPKNVWRMVRRVLAAVGILVVVVALLALAAAWRSIGKRASGERRARMEASPQWGDGRFVNPLPLVNDMVSGLRAAANASPDATPSSPVPVAIVDPATFRTPPASGLRVTWFGHSTSLVEIDGARILVDPIWSKRSSPISGVGPKRWSRPLIALDQLPPIDAVVISHDHYDHLDRGTIEALIALRCVFIVPLGVGAHLAYWGVPPDRILELDWWQRHAVGGIEIVSTPARHASGRQVLDKDATLWAGYALVGASHRVYYSGDTGLFPEMTQIGERLGPFDLTMIESGQYHGAWPDWHLGPEQAVEAHRMVRGRMMLPVHWGLLRLAPHGWTEPIERVLAEATRTGVRVVAPRPGESIEPTFGGPPVRWWPTLPWQSAAQAPVKATWVK